MTTTISIYEIQFLDWIIDQIKKDQSDFSRNLWIKNLEDELNIFKQKLLQSTNAEDCNSDINLSMSI